MLFLPVEVNQRQPALVRADERVAGRRDNRRGKAQRLANVARLVDHAALTVDAVQESVERMESVTAFFIQNDSAGNVTTRCVFPRDLRLFFGNVETDNLVLRVKHESSLGVDNRGVANGSSGFT